MNLVEQIARLIDHEGAYSVWLDGTGPDAKEHPLTTRQKYYQAKLELDAIAILKLVAGVPLERIKADLIEHEKMGWKRLGIPIDRDDETKATTNEIIAKKYADLGVSG